MEKKGRLCPSKHLKAFNLYLAIGWLLPIVMGTLPLGLENSPMVLVSLLLFTCFAV